MVGRILMDLRRDVKNIKDSIGHVTDPKKGTGAVSAQALYLEAVLERADKQLQEQSNALVSAAIRRREEMETGTVATSLGLRPPGSSPSGSPPVLAPPLTDRGPNRGPLHLGAGGGSHSAASLTAFELAVDSDDAIKFGLPKQRGGGVYEADLADGLLGLQERELIPKDADLTPALERGVPVVTTHQVHLGIYQSQFVKGAVADPLPNVGVRFDMHSPLPIPPGAPERARSTQILRAAAAAKGASEGGALAALTDGSADPSSSKPTGSFGQPHQQAGVTASSVLPTGDRTGDVFFTALPEDGELGPEGSGFGGLAAHPSSHRTNTPQQHHRSVEEMLVEPGTLDEHTGAHLILFQKGKFQQRTNEFRAFKKKQAASWSLACQVLRTVEYHLGPFALPYVCFDGDALVEAQRNAHGAEVPLEVLLSCCDQEGLVRRSPGSL
uniref:Uncharacterized protein n=1 Tax=Chromera velia CCMP2878 TaxID=1169474 RepID=A0A0G4HEV1_9ALVE|eukprot:Cvel_6587.t1-p1 / transcript=Cvel_6587.t1 / gene=Cvel_6587 / organism=Chromera_velia_CCMP2878 / gene_product=hypothetical protein / transcript_product=hypothetical protein / location=Cvel_scaffold325:28267-32562(+) / protein_length=439 / sequence_SO=supercontig / SO=protein_coding / is_pseudo=false